MDKNSLAIATIAWARNSDEETLLSTSLKVLAELGLPVFVTDGGSPEPFLGSLGSLPNVHVQTAKGLWPQARKSIIAAADSGAKAILYTEPDKAEFFRQHLSRMLEASTWNDRTGVVLASRSATGFASFPPFQQMTETTINKCCQEIVGKTTDYCYGPFLFNAQLLPLLEALPQNCGWGWRPFLFATAHLQDLDVLWYEGDFYCPPDQRDEDATERIYRMKQLTQNIEGLVLATAQNSRRSHVG